MSQNIKIRKGVDIRLVGTPADTVSAAKRSKTYAIQPPNFEGLIPKLSVQEGDSVKAGDSLFFEKKIPSIKYASPVSVSYTHLTLPTTPYV